MFGQTGHAALKGVTVNIAQPRQRYPVAIIIRRGGNACFHSGDRPALHGDADVPGPAAGQ